MKIISYIDIYRTVEGQSNPNIRSFQEYSNTLPWHDMNYIFWYPTIVLFIVDHGSIQTGSLLITSVRLLVVL